ncbi:hypothetical protein AMTRI_Chr07g81600 [Amborella trichopoda]
MVLLVLFIFLNLFPPEIITKPFTAGSVDNVEAFNRGVFNGGATTVSEMNQECNSLTENSRAIPCGHLNASQYVSSLEAKGPIRQQDQEQLGGSLHNGEAFNGGVFNGLENMTFTQLLQLDDLDVINQEPNSLTANSSGIPDGDLNAPQYFSLSEAKPHIGQQDQHQEHLIYQSPSSYQQNHWGNIPMNECHIVGHRFMPQKTMLSHKERRFQSRNHLSDSTSGFLGENQSRDYWICIWTFLEKSVPSHGEDLNAQSTGSMKCPLSKASSPQNQMLEHPASEASKCFEWLVFLHRGSTCSAPAGQCSFYLCAYAQRIWMHISICEQIQCPFLYCRQLRKLWGLYCNCSDQDCLVCSRVCILISFHQPLDFWKVDLTRNSKEALSSEPLGDVQYPPKRMRAEHSSRIQFLPEPVASIPEVSDPEQVEESIQNEGPAVVELGDTPRLFYCSLTSAHGNPGTKMQNRKELKCCSPKILSTVLSEDLQPPLKRMKFEHLPTKCISPEPLSQTSQFCDQVPVKAIAEIEEPGFVVVKDTTMKMGSSPNFCHEIPGTKMDNGMEHTTPGFVIVKDTATKMGSSVTFGHEIPGNKMNNGMEHTTEVKGGIPLISSGELSSQITCENLTELNMCKMEMNQEPAISSADCEEGTMHGKQKIQEQITDHINSLRQCVGLSIKTNSKAEHCQAMESSANQSSCQMCGMEKLSFAPPDVYCNQCGLLVKRSPICDNCHNPRSLLDFKWSHCIYFHKNNQYYMDQARLTKEDLLSPKMVHLAKHYLDSSYQLKKKQKIKYNQMLGKISFKIMDKVFPKPESHFVLMIIHLDVEMINLRIELEHLMIKIRYFLNHKKSCSQRHNIIEVLSITLIPIKERLMRSCWGIYFFLFFLFSPFFLSFSKDHLQVVLLQ